MSTDKVLVFSICLVMILVISVMIMEYIVMINLKIDYDLMCRKYFWLAEMNGGLSTEERTELRALLENRNYSDVSIESPIGIKFGEDFSIKISAKREFSL